MGNRFTGGKPLRKRFFTQNEAKDWLSQEVTRKAAYGRQAYALSPEQHRCAFRIFELWGARKLSAVEEAVAQIVEIAPLSERVRTVEETCAAFLAAKKQAGLSASYLRDLKPNIRRFEKTFGKVSIRELPTVRLQEWLNAQKVSPNSQRHFHNDFRTIFSWAVKQGWLASNPWTAVERPKKTPHKIGVLSADETKRLLTALAESSSPIIGYVAAGLFAGLRREELRRLQWEHVRLEGETPCIIVAADVAKTSSRRVVRLTPNAVKWLLQTAKRSGPVSPPYSERTLTKAARMAGISSWPRNAMRHSFASYCASVRGEVYAAEQLGHADVALIKEHYQQVVTPEEAKAYWAILP